MQTFLKIMRKDLTRLPMKSVDNQTLAIRKNKVIGQMKDKLNGKIMEKLKPLDQRCITLTYDDHVDKKPKGTKKSMINREIIK